MQLFQISEVKKMLFQISQLCSSQELVFALRLVSIRDLPALFLKLGCFPLSASL